MAVHVEKLHFGQKKLALPPVDDSLGFVTATMVRKLGAGVEQLSCKHLAPVKRGLSASIQHGLKAVWVSFYAVPAKFVGGHICRARNSRVCSCSSVFSAYVQAEHVLLKTPQQSCFVTSYLQLSRLCSDSVRNLACVRNLRMRSQRCRCSPSLVINNMQQIMTH